MAINIKEIYDTDSPAVKIDKLNYNFDQILAAGGGPIGAIGSQGAIGPTGVKGAQGAQGPIGLTGPTGTSTDYFWKNTFTPGLESITPKIDAPQSKPIALILGDTTATSGSIPYGESPLYVKTDSVFGDKVIRIGSNIDANKYVDISFEYVGTTQDVKFITTPIGGVTTNYTISGQKIVLENGGANKVILDASNSVFNSAITLNSTISIPTGASDGAILTSDNFGTATWQPPYETPIGTIVMVSSIVLNDSTKIHWNEFAPSQYHGRGKGDWAGWYFCWGKTWGGYTTPNMQGKLPVGFDKPQGVYTPNPPFQIPNYPSGSSTTSVTIPNHNHNLTVTPGTQDFLTGGPPTTYVQSVSSTTSSNGGGTFGNITVQPPAITLGYMIYLKDDNLTYP